jgi:ribokinase
MLISVVRFPPLRNFPEPGCQDRVRFAMAMPADDLPNPAPRIAVIGHVEHITLGRIKALPTAGDIIHLEQPRFFPGGGGGIAFYQISKSPGETLLYTAIGHDEAGSMVRHELGRSSAKVFFAARDEAHTRDVVMITPNGERTIVVLGQPLHPRHDDPLPWEILSQCHGVYFTAQDPLVLQKARAARMLVATARRRHAIVSSGVHIDVIVGSASDPDEVSSLKDYPVPPTALVLTEGARGGRIETRDGLTRFAPPPTASGTGSAYGAGDSFAGALTWYLSAGLPVKQACERAGAHGAAVFQGLIPIDVQIELPAPRPSNATS